MPAWLARAATSAPAERPVSAAPFIGRDIELELLERTWARTSGELHPQLVTLVGPPGIGKTRLTLEFAARVESAGGRTLRGRPLPYGEPPPTGRSEQIIRDACGIFATDSADVAAEKLGERAASLLPAAEAQELATHLSILARLAEDTVDDRQVLFASAQRFLEALAREQPTLVVLEDLHWADESLLELVEGLSARLADVPLLLLALARPEFLDARPSWARLPTNVTVQLAGAHRRPRSRTLCSGSYRARQIRRRSPSASSRRPPAIRSSSRNWRRGSRRAVARERRRSAGEHQDDHRGPARPAPGARAAGDPRRLCDRRLLLAGHRSRRSEATARSWRHCTRSSAAALSATALPRVSAVTRS